jgi:uncharacterized membrane protein YhdT
MNAESLAADRRDLLRVVPQSASVLSSRHAALVPGEFAASGAAGIAKFAQCQGAALQGLEGHNMHMDKQRRAKTRARWVLGLAGCFLAGFVAFYFIPGLPASPQGNRTHDLSSAALEALLVTIVGGLMVRSVVRPGRD